LTQHILPSHRTIENLGKDSQCTKFKQLALLTLLCSLYASVNDNIILSALLLNGRRRMQQWSRVFEPQIHICRPIVYWMWCDRPTGHCVWRAVKTPTTTTIKASERDKCDLSYRLYSNKSIGSRRRRSVAGNMRWDQNERLDNDCHVAHSDHYTIDIIPGSCIDQHHIHVTTIQHSSSIERRTRSTRTNSPASRVSMATDHWRIGESAGCESQRKCETPRGETSRKCSLTGLSTTQLCWSHGHHAWQNEFKSPNFPVSM